jgi:hypothetical protein
MTSFLRLRAIGVFAVSFVLVLGFSLSRAATNLFSTQFETAEGYDENLDLVGQLGWTSGNTGTIWNGLTQGFIAGQGQHAYIGFAAPTNTPDLFVWQPINFDPLAAGLPLVTFSVQMFIEDSTVENQNYDYFRWSLYNIQGERLFSIEFDNYELSVNYQLNGNNPIVTNTTSFLPGSNYTLTVTMNFASNRWHALLDNRLIATNQPISTTSALLNFGDMDAVWSIYDTNAPGDNYMVFDNYQITAEAITVPPPPQSQIRLLSRTTEGWALLRVFGQAGSRWSVDATTNFTHWTALTTNTVTSASFDHVDMTATGLSGRFYRARFVP